MRFKPVITLDDAKKMLAAGEAEAIKNNWNIVIAILDDAGILVALHRMDGARPGNPEIAIQKARTSALTQRSSKVWEDWVDGGKISSTTMPFMSKRGGLPIIVEGECLGAVGVSGVASHQDEQVAMAAIAAAFPNFKTVRPGD
ncbi:MAG: heme-binding protein [Betaproteobacteria bacterium]|nr:heme-binding protein [Betaproteobacteria bacterium]